MDLYLKTGPSDFPKVTDRLIARSQTHGLRWQQIIRDDRRRTVTFRLDMHPTPDVRSAIASFVSTLSFPPYTLTMED